MSKSRRIKADKVTKFIDGDSFRLLIDGQDIRVRIQGIDCPEMRGKCRREIKLARKAARFTWKKLSSAELIEIKPYSVDHYERLLCDVFCDGECLSGMLIEAGLAKTYEGHKRSWC